MTAYERMKQTYDRKKEIGMCLRCQNAAAPQKTLCENCNAKAKASTRKIYLDRKQKNLCVRCGSCPPSDGMAMCKQCRIKASAYYYKRKNGENENG